MDSFDLSEQRIVQLEQIPVDIRCQIEHGDGAEYVLDLSLNRLRSIDSIGTFEHVNELDLSGNQLENVNGIQALRRLQILDLSRNCITSVDLLALLPALHVLKVAENSLTTIDSLQLLPQLRVVDASYNRITKWPALAGLNLLETLDMSDNMLGPFLPSLSATLFPLHLRRLAIARNQIDKICGIACLGFQLPTLEFFAFDGNPIVFEITRNHGQLERLLATFFPCVPLSNDGGITMSGKRHEEFTTPLHTVNTLKRAILDCREETVDEFLVTGSVATQGVSGTFAPPTPTERPLPAQTQVVLNNDKDNSLSYDSKMEIWKRIQEDRKAQLDQNEQSFANSTLKRAKVVQWGQDVEQLTANTSLQDDIRTPALTAADLVIPDSSQFVGALDGSCLSVMAPLESTISKPTNTTKVSQARNGVDNDALVKKVKMLT
ncbi:Protein phosphatases PP1 regulatory subunit sds22, partial [Phytophthora megakarya]